jgi:hypothetical protein
LKDLDVVSVMNWIGEYDVKTDNSDLLEASTKGYLEDLLERKRTHSVASTSSETSDVPKGASTPNKVLTGRSLSIQQDMRYIEIEIGLNMIRVQS